MPQSQILNLLTAVSEYQPNLGGEIDKDKVELDRISHLATLELKQCDVLDLISSIWRGRIISSTKALYDAKDAMPLYEEWLKTNSITPKKAEELIQIADNADELIDEKILSNAGLANISLKAWKIASQDAPTLKVVSEIAEGGSEIKPATATRLLNEQTVAASTILDSEVKTAVSEGKLQPKKTAKLIKQLERLPEEAATEIVEELKSTPSNDVLSGCLETSKALADYNATAPFVENIRSRVDIQLLREEAEACNSLPLVARSAIVLREIEQLAAKLYVKQGQLQDLLDRLFVETGAANRELRTICDQLGNSQEIVVPLNSSDRKIRLFMEEIEPIAESSVIDLAANSSASVTEVVPA